MIVAWIDWSPRWRDSGDNLDGLDDSEVSRGRVDGERLKLKHLLLAPISSPLLPFSTHVEAAGGCRHYERLWLVLVVVVNCWEDLLKLLGSCSCHLLIVKPCQVRQYSWDLPIFLGICELLGFQCFQWVRWCWSRPKRHFATSSHEEGPVEEVMINNGVTMTSLFSRCSHLEKNVLILKRWTRPGASLMVTEGGLRVVDSCSQNAERPSWTAGCSPATTKYICICYLNTHLGDLLHLRLVESIVVTGALFPKSLELGGKGGRHLFCDRSFRLVFRRWHHMRHFVVKVPK